MQGLLSFFRDFYANRATAGLVVEAPKVRMARVAGLSDNPTGVASTTPISRIC